MLAGSLHGLIFYVACQLVVELQLLAIEVKSYRADLAFGEQFLDLIGLGIGKANQGFFGAAQIEWRFLLLHRLLQALDVAINVGIQQRQEATKMLWIAFMRRRGHQQVMVGHLGERFTKSIGIRLVVLRPGTHLVRFVDDHQIPTRPQQAFASVLDDGHPRYGRDDLVVFLPRILAIVSAECGPTDDVKLLAELVRHFTLPLKREVGRRDDQHALH